MLASFKKARRHVGFTLIEMLTVLVIIGILAGIIIGVAGNVQKKAATSRASAEISAIELALESYKIDNGDYPDSAATMSIPTAVGSFYNGNPKTYIEAGKILFTALCGRTQFEDSSESQVVATERVYLDAKSSQVGDPSGSSYLMDPFGYAYGYVYSAAGDPKSYYNEVVPDIWSTAGQVATPNAGSNNYVYQRWVTNWGTQH